MSRGGWLQTYTGKMFHPFDPRVEEICIEDIAHALSNLCRFAGHTRVYYSVAQHSVLVAERCPSRYRMVGLLHDAAEAYIIDLPAPVKNNPAMGDYRLLDAKVQGVIYEAFGVESAPDSANGVPPEVAYVDARMLATEARDLLGAPPAPWASLLPEPFSERIVPQTPAEAEAAFLDLFRRLGGTNPW